FLCVSRELEHFHAVAERRRNRIEYVRGRQKQHFRQVERNIEVMIAEGIVLLRVENFEQRGCRITSEVGAELVDLVEDENRVLRFGAAQTLDDLARKRADVRAPVAADFRFV